MQFKNTLLSVIASVALINAAVIPPAALADPVTPFNPVAINGGDIPETNPDYQTCINQVNAYLAGKSVSTTTPALETPDICRICVSWAYEICFISPYKLGDLDVITKQCYSNEMLACKSFYKVGPKVPEPKDLAGLPAPEIPPTSEVPAPAQAVPPTPGVPAPAQAAPPTPGVPAPAQAAPPTPEAPAPAQAVPPTPEAPAPAQAVPPTPEAPAPAPAVPAAPGVAL